MNLRGPDTSKQREQMMINDGMEISCPRLQIKQGMMMNLPKEKGGREIVVSHFPFS